METKTIKTRQLKRAVHIDFKRDIAIGASDDDRRIEVAFSSEAPVLRDFGEDGAPLVAYEVLSHKAGDVSTHLGHTGVVVEPAGGRLEAEVEKLLAGLEKLVLELLVIELTDFNCIRHQTSTSGVEPRPGRATTRAFMGSFWMARSRAE